MCIGQSFPFAQLACPVLSTHPDRREEDRLGANRSGRLPPVVRPRQSALQGWLAQGRDAPFSGQRYSRLRVVQTRRTGPDGIVGHLGPGVKRSIKVLTNCFPWETASHQMVKF